MLRQNPDPLIGTLLPRRYRITGKLGRGAMSVVYYGVYEPLQQPVAIKLLRTHLVSDRTTFQRFQQEAKTAGALEHRNIVGIFDFGVTDQGVPYLVMELLKGESLSERLKKEHCLPVESALEIFLEAADALAYTHERGIIHRDVKPSNILLVNDGSGRDRVKIVDFGIAKMQSYEGNPSLSLTATGEVFGTPLYVSPEQATAKPMDCRADIYSFGCVMYEAIAGRPAFSGPSALEIIRMQVNVDPMPINRARPDLELSPVLVDLVSKTMAKNPDDRYQSMAELIYDLRRVQSVTSTVNLAALQPTITYSDHKQSDSYRQPKNSSINSLSRQSNPLNAKNEGQSGSRAKLSPPNGVKLPTQDKPGKLKMRLPMRAIVIAFAGIGLIGGGLLLAAQFANSFGAASHRTGTTNASGANLATAPDDCDPETQEHIDNYLRLYAQHNYPAAEKEAKVALVNLHRVHADASAAAVLSDLCRIHLEEGNNKEALLRAHEAVDLLRDGPPSQRLNLATSMESLAQALTASNDINAAEKYYKDALAIKLSIVGDSDPEVAKSWQGLGILEELRGDLQGAKSYYEKALANQTVARGEVSPDVAATLRCLGTVSFKQGNYAASETYLQRATAIDQSISNGASAELASDYACLARVYESESKLGEAEGAYRMSLSISKRIFGGDNPRLVSRVKALADFLRKHHRIAEAETVARSVHVVGACGGK